MAGTGEVNGRGSAPLKPNTTRQAPATAPLVPPKPAQATDRLTLGTGKVEPKPAANTPEQVALAADREAKRAAWVEQQVTELVNDHADEGVAGNAKAFWHDMRKKDGAAGYLGAAMETLLDFSGLPALEKSSAELGARVGLGDSNMNIAKASGKVAFDAGMVALNGLAAGKAVVAVGRGARAVVAGGAAVEAVATSARVVRHYTTAADAAKIMQSGEIWATAKGMAGNDKVYLLAENVGSRGMNFLRQANIGVAKTGVAIEIDLAKLPVEVAQRFRTEGFRGFLNQENFITHAGKFDFKAFRDAVSMVPTEKLAVTFEQVLNAGGKLANTGVALGDVDRGVKGLANTNG